MSANTLSTDIQSIKDGLKALIVERLKLEIAPESIGDSVPLFSGADGAAADGGLSLDSVEALEIVVGIEERWGVAIQDDSVASEFYSIETLGNLVQRLLTEKTEQPAASEDERAA